MVAQNSVDFAQGLDPAAHLLRGTRGVRNCTVLHTNLCFVSSSPYATQKATEVKAVKGCGAERKKRDREREHAEPVFYHGKLEGLWWTYGKYAAEALEVRGHDERADHHGLLCIHPFSWCFFCSRD